MNLEVYKISVLQDCVSLLQQGLAEEKGIDAVLSEVQVYITVSRRQYEEPEVKSDKACPCGNGVLRPIAKVEGMKRIGCGRCYYSEVLG